VDADGGAVTPAVASLLALLLVVAVSLTARLNVGVLAIALAWGVAAWLAGWKPEQVMAAFPASLFLTLLGVSLLFGVAQGNGTMEAVTRAGVRLVGGSAAWLPPLFFALACVLSTAGPGAISTVALLAPLAMPMAHQAGVPMLLMALMVGNGANAGNLSPVGAVGALVHELMARIDLAGHGWAVWGTNFVAHALVAGVAWLLFGGRQLRHAARVPLPAAEPLHWRHRLTLGVLAAWVLGVLVAGLSPGLSAFAAVAVLVLAGGAEDKGLFAPVPWAVLTMVCGVSVLVGVLEKTGGMELFSAFLAKLATPATVNGVLAGITGLLSTYSSTSGVVYPTFLPAIPGMVAKLGGGDPLQMALSVNVGAALVDVSPLSTLGALCIAAVPAGEDTRRVFRGLLLWGFAMAGVAALFAQWAVPLLAGW